MFQQLIGRRNGDRADLMQAENAEPELVVPLKHQHDLVAALDAERSKVVGCLRRCVLHILESETALGTILGHMEHCELIGLSFCKLINKVKRKVELLGVLECY